MVGSDAALNLDYHDSQIYSWEFDIFALDKATCGNPLLTMTIALLESYDLLVRNHDIYMQMIAMHRLLVRF